MNVDETTPMPWLRALRYLLTLTLVDNDRPMTIAELREVAAGVDVELGGRPSKVISDALRWEVRRGRVRRLGRGV